MDELEIGPEIIPFIVDYDSSSLPAMMTLTGRGALAMPFDNEKPQWKCQMNHILPPSLEEADSGVRGPSNSGLLALSWQSLKHDKNLTELDEQPEIIALVDAIQLAHHSGKLVTALAAIRTRFPASLIWCPGLGGPDNLALLTWFGVDLYDFTRSRSAGSRGYLLTADGPQHPHADYQESAEFDAQVCQWSQELSVVKTALANGNLRALVEKRSLNSPRLVEHLRHH
ncbi:MAG: hypothetical protein QF831_05840, partial [Candidatus Thalassarchaeaceae archaeon]|nr:hypothetical protein [Candidatus Thalassarchaeaceae archaeon]